MIRRNGMFLRQPVQAQKCRRDITSHSWQYKGISHLPLLHASFPLCLFSINHRREVYKNKTNYIIDTINLYIHVSILYIWFFPQQYVLSSLNKTENKLQLKLDHSNVGQDPYTM